MQPPPNVPRAVRIHPLTAFVRRLEEDLYLRNEVAEALSLDPEHLRRADRAHPELAPSVRVEYQGRMLRLYTREDVNRLAVHFAGHEQVGKERRYSPAAVRARKKLQDRIRHFRKCAEQARDETERARLLGIAERLRWERAAL